MVILVVGGGGREHAIGRALALADPRPTLVFAPGNPGTAELGRNVAVDLVIPGPEASLVRHVRRAGWTDVGDGVLRFDIEADAFCHQMIRSVVGTLVDVGLARKHAG